MTARRLRFTTNLHLTIAALAFGCADPEPSPCCVAAHATSDAERAAPPSPGAELVAGVATSKAAAAAPAEDSLYLVDDAWQDQRAATRRLRDFAGRPVVLSMIFTHCQYACPRLVADMKAIEARTIAAGRGDVAFVLVSMDDIRDTPVRLAAFAAERGLDAARWTLLHGPAGSVQVLNAVLGGRYKRTPSGDFAHSNLVVVLDAEGRVVHRQEGLDVAPDAAFSAIEGLPHRPPGEPTPGRHHATQRGTEEP